MADNAAVDELMSEFGTDQGAAPSPDLGDAVDGLMKEFGAPETTPDTPLDNAVQTRTLQVATQQAIINKDATSRVGTGMSLWDDWSEKLQADAERQAGRAGRLVDIGPQERVESAFRFLVKEGQTVDASIMKGDRIKSLMNDVAYQTAKFLDTSGYKDVVKPEEARQIESAFLFREMVARMRPHPHRWDAAAEVGLNTLLKKQADFLGAAANPGADYASRFEALARLQALHPLQKAAVVREAQRKAGIVESDTDYAKLKEANAQLSGDAPSKALRNLDVDRAMEDLGTVFGTDDPHRLVANHNRKVQEAHTFKDLGFINGDITQHGVLVVDPDAPAGLSALSFLPDGTIDALERRMAERRTTGFAEGKVAAPESPLDIAVDAPTIESYRREFGDQLGREKLMGALSAMRSDHIKRLGNRLSYAPEPETTLPEGQEALGVTDRAFLGFAQKLGGVFEFAQARAKDIDNALGKIGPVSDINKQTVLAYTGNERLARRAATFGQAYTTIMHALVQNGQLGTIVDQSIKAASGLRNVLLNPDRDEATQKLLANQANEAWYRAKDAMKKKLADVGSGSGAEAEAFHGLSPETQQVMFDTLNSGHRLMAKVGADADAEQDERTRRMAAYMSGKGGTAFDYFKDTVGTIYYQIGQQARMAVGDVIDNPGAVLSNIVTGAGIGQGVKGVTTLRNGVTQFLMRGTILREAAKIVADRLPAEYDNVLRSLRAAEHLAKDGAESLDAIRRASVEMEALRREAVAAGGAGRFDPNRGTVSRFAHAMAEAYPHLGDFKPEAISRLVDAMPIRATTGEISNAIRFMESRGGSRVESILAQQAGAQTAQAVAVRAAEDILRVDQATTLSALRGKYLDAVQRGAVADAEQYGHQISRLGVGTTDGPMQAFRTIVDRDAAIERMAVLTDDIRRMETTLGAKGPDPAIQNKLDHARVELAQRTKFANEAADKLRNGPALEKLDVAQLLVARDTGKLGWGFFSKAGERFHNGLARLFGTENFEDVKTSANMAESISNIATQSADEWILTSSRNGAKKMRLDLLYRRAHVNLDSFIDETEARLALLNNELDLGVPEHLAEAHLADIEATESYLSHVHAERERLLTEWGSVQALPPDQGFSFEKSHLRRMLTDVDLAEIVDQNEEFFDFKSYSPGATADHDGAILSIDREIVDNERELSQIIHKQTVNKADYQKALTKLQKEAALADPEKAAVDASTKIGQPVTVFDDNTKLVLEYEGRETKKAVLQTRLERLRENRGTLRDKAGKKPTDITNLYSDLSLEDASAQLQRDVALLRSDAEAAANTSAFNGVNPLTSQTLPLHLKGRLVYQNLLRTKHNLQASGTAIKAMSDWLENAGPAERKIALAALQRGMSATQLFEKFPKLAALIENVSPSGRATFLSNIDNYLRWETQMQADLLHEAYSIGLIEEGEWRAFKRNGYDPHMYALTEGPDLVQDQRFTQLKRTYQKDFNGTSTPLDNSEFRFQRDLSNYRVHVREADGRIVDELFESPELAAAFVERKYGAGRLTRVKNGWEGVTTTGAPIRVAEPIGEAGLQMLGFEPGATLERRLARFSQLQKDIGMYRFLSSTRGIGGMVLTKEEFAQAAAREGQKGTGFERQYIQLPNLPRKFGSLSGTFVHRKVLSEMNAMKYTFQQLESWLTSVMETYGDYSAFLPRLFGRIPVAGDKLLHGVNRMVKFSQILLNFRSWISNHTSWLFFDHFVGGRLFASENLDNLALAFKTVRKANFNPREMLVGDWKNYQEAISLGIINGSVIDHSDDQMRNVMLRAIGWDDREKIANHTHDLRRLRNEEAANAASRKPVDAQHFGRLQVGIAANEAALRDFDKGRMRNMVKQFGSFFFDRKGARGVRPGGAFAQGGAALRDLYGMTDDAYRFASFLNLKRAGLSSAEAAQRVLDFSQNYGNLPAGINNLARSPLGALVPAFPYEMTRLMKNYAEKQPLRLAAAMSVIPALNAIGAGLAGVPAARINATARATANSSTLDVLEDEVTTLKIYNPVTHEAEDIIPLGRTMQPAMQMFSEYGVLSDAAKVWVPEEDDSMLANGVRAGSRFLGSFVLNTPIVNNAYSLLRGLDPVTGRPYGGDGVSWGQKIGKALGGMAKSIVPPWTPVVGRIHSDLREAWDAPVHPETGKPYGTGQVGTVALRELTGVAARGRVAAAASDTIKSFARISGIRTNPNERGVAVPDELVMISMMYQAERSQKGDSYADRLPLYGVDAEKRKFWAQLMSESSSAQDRAEAEAGLKALAAREQEIIVNGNRYVKTPTEREQAAYLKAVRDRGSVEHFARIGLLAQTATLIEANKALVNPTTVANYAEAVRLTDRWKDSYKADPGQIAQSIAVVEQWVKDPRANPALKEWLSWLTRIEAHAIQSRNREIIRDGVMERLRTQGVVR